MKHTAHLAFAAVASLVLGTTPSIALDNRWLPLATGTRWEYVGDQGGHQVQTITGERVVRGRTVAIKAYAEGLDAGLENYWLSDADGCLLLAGFRNPAVAIAYEPPIRWLPFPPPDPGPQPPQQIVAHDLLTDAVVSGFEFQVEVTGPVFILVPAAPVPYLCVGVGQVAQAASVLAGQFAFTLDGRCVPATARASSGGGPTDFHALDVGDVLYQSSELFSLTLFGLPTPAARSSWGKIKRMYR